MEDFVRSLDQKATTKRIFEICDVLHIKNVELARFFEISEVAVSLWKSGDRFPDWDKIIMFSFLVEMDLNQILVRKKEEGNLKFQEIRNRVKEINSQNCCKTIALREEKGLPLNPEVLMEVRWNPFLQDWVSLDEFDDSINSALGRN